MEMKKLPNKWTPQQLQAINARDTAIIVSAAAGSGKTSVLVERLLKQISSESPKIPADRLIVVTFTNDAAAEMKQRLTIELSKLIEQEPQNMWLSEQQALVQTAKISTIHSFCFDLIRENIQSLEISPGFRIIDDTEEKVIIAKALENVMENFYKNESYVMTTLVDFFCSKGDRQLEKIVLSLYKFIISIPFYETWLEEQKNNYSNIDLKHDDKLISEYISFLSEKMHNFQQDALIAKSLAEDIFAADTADMLYNESEMFRKISEHILNENIEWNHKIFEISSISFDRLKFPKLEKDSPEAEISEKIKKIRNKYKEQISKIADESLFTWEEIIDDLKKHEEIMVCLIKIIHAFNHEIWTQKVEKNAIGFSDAEQLAIQLLAQKNSDGKITKTSLARELSDYYKVIMIDEFQDANNTQDLIFKMLSHNGTTERNGDNIFVVGDVKQSIYRFRLANPSIFIDTLSMAEPYTNDYKGNNSAIMLNKNFRSSYDVVHFVNYVFSNIMSKKVGEIDYTEDESLIQSAEFNENNDRKTEILLVPTKEDVAENSEDDIEIVNQEAKFVAAKINEMLSNKQQVYDKGTLRPCKSRDFCILLRNKASGQLFVTELEKYGIKAHTDDVEGYLKSREISILLNLLQIIDNPLLDIPLVSVLMSPMFMLTAEEMAKVRLLYPNGSIYKALCMAIGKTFFDDEESKNTLQNEQESYYKKAVFFDKTLEDLRYCASSYSLEKLIRVIYDSTDFLSVVQVYKDGEQKKANLRLLLEYAKSYEEGVNGGLSGFIRYINTISKQGGDLKRAGRISQTDDVVAVKTIHKSKGLEFPFVFLCRTSSQFNMMDLNSQMQLNLTGGIGFKVQEKKSLKRYCTLPFIAIREKNRSNSVNEEMRLLYVALTRAKEKLFITMDLNEKTTNDIFSFASDIKINNGISPNLTAKAKSMQDWLIMCLLIHPDCKELRALSGVDLIPAETDFNVTFTNCADSDENIQEVVLLNEKALPNEKIVHILGEEISFKYNDELSKIPSKLTVSEISKKTEEHETALRRPFFISEKKTLTGAEKGVATHTFMQYADYEKASDNPMEERDRLVSKGYLTKNQGNAVDIDKIKIFFSSPLYKRISNSYNIFRERKFLMKISDLELNDKVGNEYKNTDGMLQGIADCIFEEEDGFVLIDYKTDYVTDKFELINNYARQLELYKLALDKLYDKKIKEIYIYSFKLGESVEIIINS